MEISLDEALKEFGATHDTPIGAITAIYKVRFFLPHDDPPLHPAHTHLAHIDTHPKPAPPFSLSHTHTLSLSYSHFTLSFSLS